MTLRALELRKKILNYCQYFVQHMNSNGIDWQPAMIDYELVGALGRNEIIDGRDLRRFCGQYVEVSGILSRKDERAVFVYDRIIKTPQGVFQRIRSAAKTPMDCSEVCTNGISVTSATIQMKHGGTDCPVNLRVPSSDIPSNCAEVKVRGILHVGALNLYGEGQFIIKSPVFVTEDDEPMEVDRSLIQGFTQEPQFLDKLSEAVCDMTPADRYRDQVLAGILSIVSPCLSVLLVGDPGVGKSVLVRRINNFAKMVGMPAAVLCGRGVTVAGILGPANGPDLKAGLISMGDDRGALWVLEETDKVPKDVIAIVKELMCHGKIVIGKGNYAKLQLQIRGLSVLATANFPSRYKPSDGFDAATNCNLPFHLVFLMREQHSSAAAVADSVLKIHTREARKITEKEDRELDSTVDRSNDHCTRAYNTAVDIVRLAMDKQVEWTDDALDKVHELTLAMRRWRAANESIFRRVGPITAEAMIRLSEALAKIHLSDEVKVSHIERAYKMVESQKVDEFQ